MPVPIYEGMTITDICPKTHGLYGLHRGSAQKGSPCLCLSCVGCIEFTCGCGVRQHVTEAELEIPIDCAYILNAWAFKCASCKSRQIVQLC